MPLGYKNKQFGEIAVVEVVADLVRGSQIAMRLMLGALLALMFLGSQSSAAVLPPASCGFALDSQARVSAGAAADFTGSGVLFTRYALGIRGAALIAGTHIDQTPANLTSMLTAINAHMTAFAAAHDVDNSGPPLDVNDAVIIARYLAGFRGDALVRGLTLTGTRKLGADIETYIASGCPATVTPPNPTDLPLACTIFGPSIIPLSSTAAFSATCVSTNATTSVSTPVTGLNFTWSLAPAGRLTIASGCTATTASCTVNAATEGDATVTLRATKAGYVTANASLTTKVSSNVLAITALTPKDVVLTPTQARPTIRASYSNSNATVSITTNSVRLFVDGVDVTALSTITATGITYTPTADLATGPHTLYLSVDNSDNITAQAVWGFELDVLATYELAFTTPSTPANNATVKTPTIEATLTATANKTYANKLTINVVNAGNATSATNKTVNAQIKFVTSGTGTSATSTPVWTATVPLTSGSNTLTATATFADGQTRSVTRTITYDAPPVVSFTSPNDFQTFGPINPTSPRDLTGNVERPVTLTGIVSKPIAQLTRMMINQQSATLTATPGTSGSNATTTFSFPNFFLREGTNLVTATATDSSGQIGSASLTLYVDQTAPILTIEAPVNTGLAGLAMPFGKSNNPVAAGSAIVPSALTSNATIDVRGIVNDAVEGGLKVPYPKVTVANVTTGLTTPVYQGKVSDRYFIVEDIPLDVGQNELTVTATDWVGNARSQKLTVSRVNVGSNRITLAGGNRQRGALNTELAKPLIVTAIDKAGLPLANVPLTFEVLRGTGSINPATTSSTTTTTGSGNNTVTTIIPNALTGAFQPKTKPNGVNPARRLLITTDANGRAAVWFTLGKQSGEAGNMVQVSASDANSANAALANPMNDAITESVIFTATGERGQPSRLAAEGNGSQYAETGGQPLEALSALVYDSDGNIIPGAVVAYVIEGNTEAAESATFGTAPTNANPNANTSTVSTNGRVLVTTADNNGRAAARPTMGSTAGTVKISAYAFAPNTPITAALIDNVQSDNVASAAIANFQIAVLQQSDGPTQYTGRVFDHTGKPLAGVKVSIGRTPLVVTTDTTGYFLFSQGVPPGKLDVFVDGRAVTGTTPLPTTNPGGQSSPTQYPSIHFEVLAVRGQVNQLAHPIYLPPLLMSEAKIVGGNEDVVLQIPGYAGYEMIVKANSVTFPDGTRIGPLVVSPMQIDRLPMFPPDGWGALFAPAATLQPSGTRFDPPVELRIPNSQGLKPGERSKIYQWDQDLAQFVAMGWMTASEDAAQLITEPGSGLTKAGWHVGGQGPGPCPNQAQNVKCDESCEEQKITIVNGCQQVTCKPKTKAELTGALSISIPAPAGSIPVVPDSEQPESTLMQIQTTGLLSSKKTWTVKAKSTSPYNVGQTSSGGGPLTCEASCQSSTELAGSSYLVQRQHCMLSEIAGELITGTAKAEVKACSGLCEASQTFQVRMQNPSSDTIVAFISSTQSNPALRNAIRGLACHEAGIIGGRRYNHYRSDGYPVPNGSGDGGFGIMQVTDIGRASCKALWDWRENIRAGSDIFAREKIASARTKIRSEGTIRTGTFSNPELMSCLQRSGQQWANLVSTGSIPILSEEQVVREAIRGFNGGREYKWTLADQNEARDCSRGSWQVNPRTTQNLGYVNDVLQCQ